MDLYSYKLKDQNILIYRSIFAPVKSNMFTILTNKEAVVFDPCVDEDLLHLLSEKKIEKVHILLTHEHYDHTSGVNWLKENIKTDLFCHKECAFSIARKEMNNPALIAFVLAAEDRKDGGHRYKDFKREFQPYTIDTDKTFSSHHNFIIGDLDFQVYSTPGHCPGAACYQLFEKIVFTGDTLLQNDPVITRFPESDKAIYESVTLPYLQSLSKDSIIMPGHGDPFILKDTNNI